MLTPKSFIRPTGQIPARQLEQLTSRSFRSFVLGAMVALLCLSPNEAAAAPGAVGTKAWGFRLETIPGPKVTLRSLRGRKVVLVVGRSQKAAPHCKKWMKPLLARYKATAKTPVAVYQVVVIDKSWYVPRALVLHKLKGFVGPAFQHRFLIEWYLAFAKAYAIVNSTDPTVLVIDERGVIRWRLRDRYTKKRWQRLLRAIDGKPAR